MAKTGKRAKRRMAKLRKKLGFCPQITKVPKPRFGSVQERQDSNGKACILSKTKKEIEDQESRQRKQQGWDENN